MAKSTIMTTRNYGPGSTSFGPVSIGDSLSSVEIAVARCTSADNTIFPSDTAVLAIAAECSVNNGPWQPMFDGTVTGGIDLDKNGNEVASARIWAQFPTGANRRVQGTVSITERQRLSATIEIL